MIPTTKTITDKLLAEKPEELDAPYSEPSSICLRMQFLGNILDTISDTGLAIAILITDSFSLDEAFLKMSWVGFGAAIPIALYLSLCESKCHDVTSRLIDRADAGEKPKGILDIEMQSIAKEESANPQYNLNWKQWVLSSGHYLSDIFSSMQRYILIAKLGGIDSIPPTYRGLSYAGLYTGLGLYGALTNAQVLKDTVNSFKDKNKVLPRNVNSPR